MLELIIDSLLDAVMDTVKLIPFLLITYIIMEYMERRTEEKSAQLLERAGKYGPIAGAAVGVVPQCGFSAAAASLYSGGVISIGTLLAVFLSTSDEMLPIFISETVPAATILRILLAKVLIGLVTGMGFDAILRRTRYKHKTEKRIHDLCEQEHCGCEDEEDGILGILKSALVHTLHIITFIFIISFFITLVVEGAGEDVIAGLLTGKPVLGVFIAGIIGLIPNCAASIMITQLYLENLLSAGQMMAGLLVGAGVGLLVLFRTNRHLKENIKIAVILYGFGVFWGLLLEFIGIAF